MTFTCSKSTTKNPEELKRFHTMFCFDCSLLDYFKQVNPSWIWKLDGKCSDTWDHFLFTLITVAIKLHIKTRGKPWVSSCYMLQKKIIFGQVSKLHTHNVFKNTTEKALSEYQNKSTQFKGFIPQTWAKVFHEFIKIREIARRTSMMK